MIALLGCLLIAITLTSGKITLDKVVVVILLGVVTGFVALIRFRYVLTIAVLILLTVSSCIIPAVNEKCVVLQTSQPDTSFYTNTYRYKVCRIESGHRILWITDKYEYQVGDTILYPFQIGK